MALPGTPFCRIHAFTHIRIYLSTKDLSVCIGVGLWMNEMSVVAHEAPSGSGPAGVKNT